MAHGTGGTVTPASGWRNAGAAISINAMPATGYSFTNWAGSGTGSFSGTNNRLQLQWADPSQKRRPSLIIDADTCGVTDRSALVSNTKDSFNTGKTDFSSLGRALELRIELNRSLEMFFGHLVHSEIFQPKAEHPMKKRIVRSELIG